MSTEKLRIIVNGATGGIARRQHLAYALGPIIREGGLRLADKTILPELVLVARNATNLARAAEKFGVERWTTDLDAALSDPDARILFDAGFTGKRGEVVRAAIAAGKHIYTEKPVVTDLADGAELLVLARESGTKFGVVEDKQFLPGIAKLRHLARTGYFGTITNFRLNFGYWFFSGHDHPDPRGSWNNKLAEGGGLVRDTYPHWRYVIEGILGPIRSVVAKAWTAVPDRLDETGTPYVADADDSSVAILEMESGAIGSVTCSTQTRVRADDLISFQIDGARGSAVGGLHRCHIQPAPATPRALFDPNFDHGVDYRNDWQRMPDVEPPANGYRRGWEAFIRHVVADAPLAADLKAGLRDVALGQAVLASARDGRWVRMDEFAP